MRINWNCKYPVAITSRKTRRAPVSVAIDCLFRRSRVCLDLDRSQSSYGAPSSSEPSTFAGTPKLVMRNKCNTFHHPQCVKLLAGQGTTDTDTNFYASTDIITGTNGNQSDVSSTLRGVCGTSLISRAINNTPQMIVPPRKVELIASDTVPPGELFGEGKFGQVCWKREERKSTSLNGCWLDFCRTCPFSTSSDDSTIDESIGRVTIDVQSRKSTLVFTGSSESRQYPL